MKSQIRVFIRDKLQSQQPGDGFLAEIAAQPE
jgi:hypothetical protein